MKRTPDPRVEFKRMALQALLAAAFCWHAIPGNALSVSNTTKNTTAVIK